MISKQTIDKIFDAIRVEEIIGEYVQLKRAGANLKGLSPFKDEKTPSFVVSPSKQIWKDFSTGKGGNAISFLMDIESFTYPEALRYAAKKYGIEIEEDRRELSEEQLAAQGEKEVLFKIHEVAAAFFRDQLLHTDEGQQIGLAYFRERDIRPEMIEKFHLGYSPIDKSAFTQYALGKGYTKENLEKSGLSIFPEGQPAGIDRFRERVIFPIHGFSGRVVGFGGRVLKNNAKTAKYLNSPESAIYHKSNVLYGLHQAKQAISREDVCLLTEGYMDVVALHQAGIENSVASSGTALTPEQIKLIKRLTQNITILFDGDAAGIKASFRSIDLILQQGMNVRVLLFPDGDDPDSFSRKHTRDEVEQFIRENAQDFINFKARILLTDAGEDPIRKAEAIRDIVRSVAYVENALKQEIFIKEIATKFSLSEQSLFNELKIQASGKEQQHRDKERRTENRSGNTLQVAESAPALTEQLALLNLEQTLINLMLKYGDRVIKMKDEDGELYETTVVEEILDFLEDDDYELQNPANKIIVKHLADGLAHEQIRSGGYFFTLMDEEITGKVADALVEPYDVSDWSQHSIFFQTEEQVLANIVRDTKLRHKREQIIQMIQQIKSNVTQSDDAMSEYQKIVKLTALKNHIDELLYRIV